MQRDVLKMLRTSLRRSRFGIPSVVGDHDSSRFGRLTRQRCR